MRFPRYASYVLALGFFLLMQGLNVARNVERKHLSAYSRSLIEFLGLRNERDRYLFIQYKGKTRGYSGLQVERIIDQEDASYRVSMQTVATLIPWLGPQGDIELQSEFLLNDRGKLAAVTADLTAGGQSWRFRGNREGGQLTLTILTGGAEIGPTVKLPAELGLGGVIFPMPPLGELAVGDEREIPYFDPLTRQRATCSVRALRHTEVTYAGLRMEGIVLEVTARVGRFEVTAAPDGDVLAVKAPGGFELRRATAQEVRAYVKLRHKHDPDPDGHGSQ